MLSFNSDADCLAALFSRKRRTFLDFFYFFFLLEAHRASTLLCVVLRSPLDTLPSVETFFLTFLSLTFFFLNDSCVDYVVFSASSACRDEFGSCSGTDSCSDGGSSYVCCESSSTGCVSSSALSFYSLLTLSHAGRAVLVPSASKYQVTCSAPSTGRSPTFRYLPVFAGISGWCTGK